VGERGEQERDTELPRELAELAAAGRSEWRDAREAEVRDAAEHWAHTRTLHDATLDWLHHGDALAVDVAGIRLRGEVADVGEDLIVLRTASGRVDVHAHQAAPLVLRPERRRAGGVRSSAGPRSFRAALLEREGTRVVVGVAGSGEVLDGRLVVARDHIRLTTVEGTDVVVPLAGVAYVRPAPED
jgi:hypothetical protein